MVIEENAVYKPDEVAKLLRCGRSNVYELMALGKIATTSVGAGMKGKRIMGSAVLAFLEARTEGGPQPRGTFKYLTPRA